MLESENQILSDLGDLFMLICPHCGIALEGLRSTRGIDSDGGVETRPPREGDANVCFECSGLSFFRVSPLGFALRLPTMEELAEILSYHGDYVVALRAFNRKRAADPGLTDKGAFLDEMIEAVVVERRRQRGEQ